MNTARHTTKHGINFPLVGILLACLLTMMALPSRTTFAQTEDDFGAWFSVNTQGKVRKCKEDSKLRWWFDGHLRYFEDSGGYNQSIFRPGIGYQLNPNTNVWLGYAWINELPTSGASPFDENRIWQQLIWTKQLDRQTVFSRSRLEQRFVETGNDTGWRFRQFVKMDRPFHESSSASFVVWDEMMLDLNTTDWGQQGSFSQNRLFLGLGAKLNGPNSPKIEIGYLNQFLRRKSAGDRFGHILSANWFWTF